MKKKLSALLLCLCLCVGLFTACGGDGSGVQKLQQLFDPSEQTGEEENGQSPFESPEQPAGPPPPEVELLRTYRYEGDDAAQYVSLLAAHYDVARLSEESAVLYPQLAAALVNFSDSFRRDKEAGLDEELSWAREQYEWMPDTFYAYSDESSLTVRRADAQAVSLLYLHYSYTGGVHPNHYYAALNYDTAAGREIALGDVVSDFNGLKTEMEKRLIDEYGEDTFFDLHDQLQTYTSEQFAWTLEPEGLRFYFSPYELAPYAAGSQQVFLPLTNSRRFSPVHTGSRRGIGPCPSPSGRTWPFTGARAAPAIHCAWRRSRIMTISAA